MCMAAGVIRTSPGISVVFHVWPSSCWWCLCFLFLGLNVSGEKTAAVSSHEGQMKQLAKDWKMSSWPFLSGTSTGPIITVGNVNASGTQQAPVRARSAALVTLFYGVIFPTPDPPFPFPLPPPPPFPAP